MINTALLPADKDPMGAAIADYFKRHKADRLRVFSSQFDEDEIPVEELFRTEKQMPLLERTALQMATGRILDVGAEESIGCVVSSIGNMGPGLGDTGPAYSWNALPDAAKWLLSFLMLLGRLELFTVLLLFTPEFWKRN